MGLKLKLTDPDNSAVVTSGKRVGAQGMEGAQYVVMEVDLTLGGGHTVQVTDLISEMYI